MAGEWSFHTWDRISRDPALAARARWPEVWSKAGALRELGRRAVGRRVWWGAGACGGVEGPARLVNVCRVALFFRGLGGVVAGVEAVLRDPEVSLTGLISGQTRLTLGQTYSAGGRGSAAGPGG